MNDEQTRGALTAVLARNGRRGEVQSLARLTGGATKTTWSFDWLDDEGRHPFILQQTPPRMQDAETSTRRPPKLSGDEDAALMIVAREAGVAAPRVVHVLAPADGLGGGYITERIDGEALGKRIVADAAFDAVRPRLAAQCGEILAAIHRMPVDGLPFLARLSPADELAIYAGLLKEHAFVHPALSYAVRWIGERLPPDDQARVVHADFRTGNLIVDPAEGVRCVLDWEIARIGDPMHDLGVLCMRSWRFGGKGEVGGFGSREDLYTAYERASGISVDPRRVRFWEAMSNLKWAISCVRRGLARGADGKPASSELAAIGRRLEEPLWDFMTLATAKD
ncbi:phosphotransferase family protein [Variovorax sp. Sphag1AA]|uniref:phosphotransferase family protein n=1 Tax=Variovorax sp. Sphag1AA TaxID=2587027 RepID=UPI00160A37F9|nr:phosphotransferase family protein [Variovorax sp. Sphag1AA]MBB3182108.1 aminoglycoside phosphotransferase (APT) family kinase protein [Variovorax sp. Sphag1AA]